MQQFIMNTNQVAIFIITIAQNSLKFLHITSHFYINSHLKKVRSSVIVVITQCSHHLLRGVVDIRRKQFLCFRLPSVPKNFRL